MKLHKHIEQKKQEISDCQEAIVQTRQATEKLEEDIRLAQRERDLALSKKQKEVDELRARVNNYLCIGIDEEKCCSLSSGFTVQSLVLVLFLRPLTSLLRVLKFGRL